jgi:mRNA-degrading endonuclease toxin of MazEF toxin-antitoxin module
MGAAGPRLELGIGIEIVAGNNSGQVTRVVACLQQRQRGAAEKTRYCLQVRNVEGRGSGCVVVVVLGTGRRAILPLGFL